MSRVTRKATLPVEMTIFTAAQPWFGRLDDAGLDAMAAKMGPDGPALVASYGPIDLKGGTRVIKEIRPTYRTRVFQQGGVARGRAVVEFWGQH